MNPRAGTLQPPASANCKNWVHPEFAVAPSALQHYSLPHYLAYYVMAVSRTRRNGQNAKMHQPVSGILQPAREHLNPLYFKTQMLYLMYLYSTIKGIGVSNTNCCL